MRQRIAKCRGVSFRSHPATSHLGFLDNAFFVLDWRHQGISIANRLGLVAITAGPHNTHFHVPGLIQYAVQCAVAAVQQGETRIRLDTALTERMLGRIENPEIMQEPPATAPVAMTRVPRFIEDARMPLLPAQITDRKTQLNRFGILSSERLEPPPEPKTIETREPYTSPAKYSPA